MKIHIIQDEHITEPEITIVCREISEEIRSILATAQCKDNKLTGIKDGQIFILHYDDIIYIRFQTTDGQLTEVTNRLNANQHIEGFEYED